MKDPADRKADIIIYSEEILPKIFITRSSSAKSHSDHMIDTSHMTARPLHSLTTDTHTYPHPNPLSLPHAHTPMPIPHTPCPLGACHPSARPKDTLNVSAVVSEGGPVVVGSSLTSHIAFCPPPGSGVPKADLAAGHADL